MDIEEFRKAGYAAIDRICDYYANIESRPVVAQVEPGFLVKSLPDHAPEDGEPIDQIAKDFQDLIMPGITHWQHPSFFGYFPSNASFAGILGDLYSVSISNPGFNWLCSPACTELEQVVMDWAATLLGLDDAFHIKSGKGGGAIQGTASDSALLAGIAARIRFQTANPDIPVERLIVYVSSETHSLGEKTAMLLGLKCRKLPVLAEDDFCLRGSTIKAAYEEDRAAGLWPFILIATVGTTSSGAIDRLDELGPLANSFADFWLHVDAAWAGMSYACPEYRDAGRLADVNAYADSFCTNFHKWGLVNFDASTFWVRDRRHLTEALEITPTYLRTKHGDAVIDYRNWQVALGRRFRSAKLWFVLRSYGVNGFRNHIRKSVDLGIFFEALVRESPLFEIITPRVLGLVVFLLVPPPQHASEFNSDKLNKLNLELHRRMNEGSDALFITRTELGGKVCLRMAIGGVRTEKKHVQAAFDTFGARATDLLVEQNLLPTKLESSINGAS